MCMGKGGVRVKLGERGGRGREGQKGGRERERKEVGSRPVPCLNVSQSPVGLQVQTGGTLK